MNGRQWRDLAERQAYEPDRVEVVTCDGQVIRTYTPDEMET